jgi:hypothetical protein
VANLKAVIAFQTAFVPAYVGVSLLLAHLMQAGPCSESVAEGPVHESQRLGLPRGQVIVVGKELVREVAIQVHAVGVASIPLVKAIRVQAGHQEHVQLLHDAGRLPTEELFSSREDKQGGMENLGAGSKRCSSAGNRSRVNLDGTPLRRHCLMLLQGPWEASSVQSVAESVLACCGQSGAYLLVDPVVLAQPLCQVQHQLAT